MLRPRVSIASLMAVVLVAALGIAALRNADEAWLGAVLSLDLFLLAVAVLGAVLRREERRALWFGLALFLGGYLILVIGPGFSTDLRPKLPTSRLLAYTHKKLNTSPTAYDKQFLHAYYTRLRASNAVAPSMHVAYETQYLGAKLQSANATDHASSVVRFLGISGDADHFEAVGHCLFAAAFGLIGGLIARRFCRSEQARDGQGREVGAADHLSASR